MSIVGINDFLLACWLFLGRKFLVPWLGIKLKLRNYLYQRNLLGKDIWFRLDLHQFLDLATLIDHSIVHVYRLLWLQGPWSWRYLANSLDKGIELLRRAAVFLTKVKSSYFLSFPYLLRKSFNNFQLTPSPEKSYSYVSDCWKGRGQSFTTRSLLGSNN